MEYMRIEGFLGNVISKFINKGVRTKFGYDPFISLNNLNFKTEGDNVIVTVSMEMTQKNFERLFEEVTK